MKRFFPFASLFTLLIGMATPVFSATFTVNNTTDTQDANAGNGTCADAGGNCTFRAAVMECNALAGADTIILPAGTYTFTLTGTGEDACLTGDLDVTSNIVVFGANARTTLVNADSLDRILHVQSAGVLELNRVTLYDGYILGEHGGGIYNEGSITTDQVMLMTSGSQGTEGGLVIAGGWGGGIYNDGTLNMTRTTIGMNACIGMTGARGFIGGGGGGGAGGFGGGIFNENGATVNATNCTFSGNIATGGTGGRGSRWSGGNYTGDGGNGGGQSGAGGIGSGQAGFPGGWGSGGGGSSGSPTSNGGGSIGGTGGFGGGGGAGSGNAFGSGAAPGGPGGTWGGNGQNHCCDAAGGGGGGAGLGGGLFNNGGTLTFVSVTLAENEANGALGGPGHYGGRGAPGNGVGGGIFNLSGTVNISNTLVGQNVASTQNQDLWGTYASTLGYNLVESPGNASLGGTTTGNVTGQNPNLGPLANNGGETNTHRLIPCGPPSPAIDAGTATGTPPLDQRDTARVLITDIGAYESTFIPPPYFLPQDTIFCLGDTIMIDGGANYSVFNWNTGASGRFLEVSAPGTYYIDVQDTNGCPGTDTIIVTNLPVPPVDLGNDSTGCALNDFTLDAGGNYPVYQWQNNTSLSTLQTAGSGLYWVEVTDTNGCQNRDSIVVTSNALPVVNLGADFQICPDAQDTLIADSGFVSYLWQDNSTNDTLISIGAGQFWVLVTDTNGCTDRDTIELTDYPAPTVITSNDPVEICPGGTGTITAAAFAGYLWSDNSTADTLLVTGPGQYTLAATDANGCTWLDTINVVEVPVVNSNILGDSLEFCSDLPDDPILSATGTYTSYLWQDTVSSPSLTVNQAGDYWIEVIDSNGCIIQDTVVVEFFAVTPFDLGEPQEICPGEMVTLTLSNPSPYDSLIWADGTVGPTYVASDSGTFTLAAWFRGCVIEDSARVDTCPSTIFIPNVFTPNGDGNNDFLNFDEENLEVKEIYIYDRWGREIWYSTEEGAYWDGNQNGSPAQEGVYYFTIRYKLLTRTPAEIVEEKGHVTLLR